MGWSGVGWAGRGGAGGAAEEPLGIKIKRKNFQDKAG